jgi:hypothetical protein
MGGEPDCAENRAGTNDDCVYTMGTYLAHRMKEFQGKAHTLVWVNWEDTDARLPNARLRRTLSLSEASVNLMIQPRRSQSIILSWIATQSQ